MTPWQNEHVFVGCFEISVIVKHPQSIRITDPFVCLEILAKIFSALGIEEIAELWFARGGGQYPGRHYG